MITRGTKRPHTIALENPDGEPVPDGNGGYTQDWIAMDPPRANATIEVATARALERATASTVLSQATHVVNLRYHPDVTTKSRIKWTDRSGREHIANVIDVNDISERGIELNLIVAEIVE